MKQDIRILTAGEQGIVIEFGNSINPDINRRVHQLAGELNVKKNIGIIETVPTYRSLLVYFDPVHIARETLIREIQSILAQMGDNTQITAGGRVIAIPVCYGGEYGEDLPFVASHNKLTEQAVIDIHTSVPYLVYMLGFTPGFPYLGGMSDKIATPRLTKPRTRIPAGSVGIAGSQTGFYPIESPGGWQLIGRTPVRAFDPSAAQPFLFAAGDYLKFEAITQEQYLAIQREVEAGRYKPVITGREGGDQ